MDWSSSSQQKSKNFHLMNITHKKKKRWFFLKKKKRGRKIIPCHEISHVFYFSLMVELCKQSSILYLCLLSLCKPWNHEINYVHLPPWTYSSVALCLLMFTGITSNIPNLCQNIKQLLLLLVEQKELPQKYFLLFLQCHFFAYEVWKRQFTLGFVFGMNGF